jgi:hypothetical protein
LLQLEQIDKVEVDDFEIDIKRQDRARWRLPSSRNAPPYFNAKPFLSIAPSRVLLASFGRDRVQSLRCKVK